MYIWSGIIGFVILSDAPPWDTKYFELLHIHFAIQKVEPILIQIWDGFFHLLLLFKLICWDGFFTLLLLGQMFDWLKKKIQIEKLGWELRWGLSPSRQKLNQFLIQIWVAAFAWQRTCTPRCSLGYGVRLGNSLKFCSTGKVMWNWETFLLHRKNHSSPLHLLAFPNQDFPHRSHELQLTTAVFSTTILA